VAKQGIRVKRDDLIGYVGDTGRSTGAHLHYGVYVNDVPVNPRKYMK
jgi:murein DD-endopeptidase MepM/ murein hydrolase activator NlpD